jgi:hypothetical protein
MEQQRPLGPWTTEEEVRAELKRAFDQVGGADDWLLDEVVEAARELGLIEEHGA